MHLPIIGLFVLKTPPKSSPSSCSTPAHQGSRRQGEPALFPPFIATATAEVTKKQRERVQGAELPDPPPPHPRGAAGPGDPSGSWEFPRELRFPRDLGIPQGTGGCLESWGPFRELSILRDSGNPRSWGSLRKLGTSQRAEHPQGSGDTQELGTPPQRAEHPWGSNRS